MNQQKTVLVLGGAQQHCKLVEAIRKIGARSVVVDYLESSPAKLIADQSYLIDVNDLDSLADICKRECVDGVVSGWLDPCQMPYFKLCQELGFRYYGTEKAFRVMTDKEEFKRYCLQSDVGTIPYISGDRKTVLEQLDSIDFDYPLFVKPIDSRGSRGQTICNSEREVEIAIDNALDESLNDRVLIEKDMTGADDISVTYFFCKGEAYLERISDRILGKKEDGISNVCIGTISPSKYYEKYMNIAHANVVKMIKNLGINDGPVFLQGFVYNDKFYFYDPGLRFPGGDYERALKQATGIDLPERLVRFALGEEIEPLASDLARLNNKVEIIHDICVSEGTIEKVLGLELVEKIPEVVSVNQRYNVGERVKEDTNVGRRFAEINFLANSYSEALGISEQIQDIVSIRNQFGDMTISPFVEGFKEWMASLKVRRA